MTEDPEVAKAKALAAGPLGESMSKFPLLFAKPAFFGQRPTHGAPVEIRSGTATLVDLGDGPIAITCQHVISAARQKFGAGTGAVFQLGHIEVDPIAQLIDENERLDVATIRLTAAQANAITSEGEFGSCIFKPASWPPLLPKAREFIAFGGFPGAFRSILSFDELEFRSWSNGAAEVASTSDLQFASAFQREYWVNAFGDDGFVDFNAFGGMSGGPAFIKRAFHWELVGGVKHYHEAYDAMFFASLSWIRRNGTIEVPPG